MLTLTQDVISRHCSYLARSLYERLADLKHRDGSPVVELYADEPVMYGDPSAQGPTFAFNIMREDGSYVPWTEVERLANNAGVYIRAGGKRTALSLLTTADTVFPRCLLPWGSISSFELRRMGVGSHLLKWPRLWFK